MRSVDVLVVGAGPTGLMLAGWLARHGVSIAVLDAKAGVAPESRALAVHARSMETYDQLGLGGQVLARGRVGQGISLWVRRQQVARLGLEEMGQGVSPHPYVMMLSQNENEQILLDHLTEHGGSVLWKHRLLSLREGGAGVLASVEGPAGSLDFEARYVCGCDGAGSAVRRSLGLRFPGGTYAEEFYVADVEAHGDLSEGDVNMCVDRGGFQLVFPMPGANRFRLVGILPDQFRGREDLDFEEIVDLAAAPFGIEVTETTWFSSYKVHHRVSPHFRLGRCFLLGDAAHVHSPVGGQGMNTGLMDAANLGWKLAAVVRGGASDRLLDTYAEERVPFAHRLVSTTDRAFALVTSRAPWAPYFRLLLPRFLSIAARFDAFRRFMFRVISQVYITYQRSWASRQLAASGGVRAGDRLPWVSPDGGPGNFDPLGSCDWQAHVYGETEEALRVWSRLPVFTFDFSQAARRAGLARDTTYLIRPDGYIGLVCRPFDSTVVDQYLQEMGAFR